MRHTVRTTIDAFIHYLGDLSGRPTQSIRFPKKLIYYYLSIFRNAVLYEEVKKRGREIDLTLLDTIPCIELVEVDVIGDCPCAAEKGCKWLKSKHPIPDLLCDVPYTVITLDGMIEFDFVEWFRFSHKLKARYSGTRLHPYYTFRNIKSKFHLYLYANSELTKTTQLESIAMTAIFKDPLDVLNFPVCGKTPSLCDVLDQDFLIPRELESTVFLRTYNALMSLNRLMMPNGDTLNNDNNDSAAKVPV